MNTKNKIKNQIQMLFQTNPIIHVDVSINRPRITLSNQEARIKGVYKNIFQIESNGTCYSIQYSELLINTIRIAELENRNDRCRSQP